MKKIILSMVLLFALLMCITGCSGSNGPEPTPGGDKPLEQTIYEKLESFADKNYSKVTLKVNTDTDGIQLSAEYILTQYNVLYSFEQMNLFPSDGDISDLNSEYKSTVTGSAIISNGEIIIVDDTNVTLPSYEELRGDFNFSENNLKNTVLESNSLKAEVISPSIFYGSEVNLQNMTIDVEYSDVALTKVTIIYQTSYSTVTTTYEFEN